MTTTTNPSGIDRRTILMAGGVTLAGAAMPALAQSDQSSGRPVDATETPSTAGRIMRAVPKTGEQMPAVGLGTFLTFDRTPGADRADLGEVFRRFVSDGGRVIDTSPLYGTAEVTVGQLAASVGAEDLFISNKVWATGGFLADDRQAEDSLNLSRERLWHERIDLMQCHSLVNVDVMVPLMRAWKKEGRIRYLGVTHYELPYFEALADWVDKGDLDFVQVHYSIATRDAERRIIPAAVEKGVAVSVNMPLEKARLHEIVKGRPLPDYAAELGIESWSAFFLKWVLGNPAVTCVLPATTNPDHLTENMAALRGPLPDQAMRARMVRTMEAIPGFDRIGAMPWYPGKRFTGIINAAQQRTRQRGS